MIKWTRKEFDETQATYRAFMQKQDILRSLEFGSLYSWTKRTNSTERTRSDNFRFSLKRTVLQIR